MTSLWHETAHFSPRPTLEGDIETEAAVIGGGMAGILTAAMLEEAGVRTVVLEADRVGSGQTGGTTAKVTAQHGTIYRRLEEHLGGENAALYAQANQEAVERYEKLIRDRDISCGWQRLPAYLYSMTGDPALEAETAAQERAGLPVCLTEHTALPFPVKGAARCDRQGQFHPLQFLFALSEGLTVYEHTRALSVEGGEVRTDHGAVRAGAVIFACHFPFLNMPGYYFARMHQERSYVLALRGAPAVEGMYYSVDAGGLSLRQAGDYLLVGGGGHRTGENKSGGQYDALSRSSALLFPGAREAFRWSAQDCVTLDGLPYIGQFSAATPRWYVATGFAKWGMTSAMVSAVLIRDLLTGKDNPYAGLFSPQRFTPAASMDELVKNSVHAARDWGREWFTPGRADFEALPLGHGGIVDREGKKVGVYKSPEGDVFLIDPCCPHMGCQLEWNPEEKSWDCPCHGSRFDVRGGLLTGPAQAGLNARQWRGE